MHFFCGILKKYKDDFVALNVDMSDLISHSACKCAAKFCVSVCTVAPPITSISLLVRWLVGNLKILYLRYKVAGDHFCCRALSVLNPVTYKFSVSCCYYETMYETSVQLETYIREVFPEVHALRICMYIILKFLIASMFCHCDYLCDMLPPSNILHKLPCFMAQPPYLLCCGVYFFPLGAKKTRPI